LMSRSRRFCTHRGRILAAMSPLWQVLDPAGSSRTVSWRLGLLYNAKIIGRICMDA